MFKVNGSPGRSVFVLDQTEFCGMNSLKCFFFSILFTDLIERQHFHSVHNCVYFAAQVLDYQFE